MSEKIDNFLWFSLSVFVNRLKRNIHNVYGKFLAVVGYSSELIYWWNMKPRQTLVFKTL